MFACDAYLLVCLSYNPNSKDSVGIKMKPK